MSLVGSNYQRAEKPVSSEERVAPRLSKKQKVLASFGSLAITLGVINTLGYTLENKNPPIIKTYSGSRPATDSLVAFSGLGGYGSDLYCTLNAIDPRNVLGLFHNGRFDLKQEAQMLAEQASNTGVERFTILGDSAGGLMAIKVGVELINTTDIQVSEIHLVTTPISPDDIRPTERIMAEVSSIALVGGFASRLLGETALEINKDYSDGWINSIQSVLSRSTAMPSNVLRDQLTLVKQGVSEDDIKTLIKHGSKIIYFAPQQEYQDKLVNTDTAYERLREIVIKAIEELDIQGSSVDNYLSLARLGYKHSMIALSEEALLNGAWVQNTNATRANSSSEIRELSNNENDDCQESYSDVAKTIGLASGDYNSNIFVRYK